MNEHGIFFMHRLRPGHYWPWQLIYQNKFWAECHQAKLYFPKHKNSAWGGKDDFHCEINKVDGEDIIDVMLVDHGGAW